MYRYFLMMAALLGATGVMLGAFGAHGLKPLLSAERFEVFQTAVSYQLWHALALAVVSGLGLALKQTGRALAVSGGLMIAGTLCFSGSLYLLVLLDKKILGAVTPIGGSLLILGWFALALSAGRLDQPSERKGLHNDE